jgi:SAM-dependent methyltransferase
MTFDPAWLALREGYDHAVRDRALTEAFVKALGATPKLVDLGCGTGSNLRYLAPHLPGTQRWICIDYDPRLLACLSEQCPEGVDVETYELDLAADLEAITIGHGMGVTGAALLDLASAVWLDRLAAHCREAVLLMTLSFDGRMIWDPIDAADEAVNDAFCRHQRSDKGFGPALGPDAASYLAERLEGSGHDVLVAPSDWVFRGEDVEILRSMVDGVSAAAGEADPRLELDAWRARRREEIDAQALSLTVGHIDVLALP